MEECCGRIVHDVYYHTRLGYRTYYFICKCSNCGRQLGGENPLSPEGVLAATGKTEPDVAEIEAYLNNGGKVVGTYHIVRRVKTRVLASWVIEAGSKEEAAAILAADPNRNPSSMDTTVEQFLESPTGPYPRGWFDN
jgi:hypothetical protein